jgi:histidine triad (HIT) family protein
MNGSGGEACIFCKIAQRQIPANIIYEDDHAVAFPDMKPVAPVHLLIIPKKHIARLSDVADTDQVVMGRMLAIATVLAKDSGIPDFRTVINCGPGAGQTVFHLHLHLLGGRPFHWPPG